MGSVLRRQRHQTIETVTTLYNGKLRLERRNGNPTLHARTFLHGKIVGKSTGETTLGAASRVATDWYLDRLDRIRTGDRREPDQRSHARTFRGTLVKPTTIKKDLDFVRCVLRFAKREQYLTELPEFPDVRWICAARGRSP